MLIKSVCMKCIKERRPIHGWTDNDDIFWIESKKVACLSTDHLGRFPRTYEPIPYKCKYYMEHIVLGGQ